jgi:hypothetical protein
MARTPLTHKRNFNNCGFGATNLVLAERFVDSEIVRNFPKLTLDLEIL